MEFTKSPEYIINNFICQDKITEAQEYLTNFDDISYYIKKQKTFISLAIKIKIKLGLFSHVSEIIHNGEFPLMKRDYLLYIINIYDTNPVEAIYIFNNYVLENFEILQKDIDLLIDNKCYHILKSLEGKYFTTTKTKNVIDYSCLKKYNFDIEMRIEVCDKIKIKLEDKSFLDFITKINNYYDVIIDGGNILFSCGGKVSLKGYKYLLKIMEKFKNPLLIIHHRHRKKNKNEKINLIINSINEKYYDNIYKTPYGYNDDWYILFSSLFLELPIVSNDNFKDHIFEFEKSIPYKSHFLKNYFEHYTLNHNCISNKIQSIRKYNKCIQIIDDNIYIPTKDGFYLEF